LALVTLHDDRNDPHRHHLQRDNDDDKFDMQAALDDPARLPWQIGQY
jgi:hypothetical protein